MDRSHPDPERSERLRAAASRIARTDEAAAPVRPERPVSYQQELHDWADYPRLGLPLVGLVSLVGLLWVWLAGVIGDGTDQPPTPTVIAQSTEQIAPISAPPTVEPTASPLTASAGTEPPTPTPTLPVEPPTPTSPGPFQINEVVITVVDRVRLRAKPSTGDDSVVLEELPLGTQLTITAAYVPGIPDEGGWWPVINPASGRQGFVNETLIGRP
jgi:hypothetical protein